MNLVILFETDFVSDEVVRLYDNRFEHLKKILKVKSGGIVKVGLLNKMMGTGEVVGVNSDSIDLRVNLTDKAPDPLPLTLICALQRPQTMKKVLQASVAYGVKNIYFINTWKVEKSYWSSPLLEEEALNRHMILGLEQSCDTILPEIHFRRKFKAFVEDELKEIVGDSIGITAHPSAERICPSCVDGRVTLCIGPEGGFIDSEVDILAENLCPTVRLGVSRPLRTEFALCALLGRLF